MRVLRLLDELHTFSTLRQTRILKCCSPFYCRKEKRAQSMLLVAVLLRGSFALGMLDIFLELHVADTCDDGQHFSPLSAAFFGLLFGVEQGSCRFISTSCGHTHPVSEDASETTRTNCLMQNCPFFVCELLSNRHVEFSPYFYGIFSASSSELRFEVANSCPGWLT